MSPIAVFCYNRKDKIESCLNSLVECEMVESTEIFVFSDGAPKDRSLSEVNEVRRFLIQFLSAHKNLHISIIKRDENYGLAKSIISGVTQVIKEHGSVIVIEDDLVLSKDFLVYMNNALDFYRDKSRYGSISAYTYPIRQLKRYKKDVYALRKGECWGWATWLDRWENVDWELQDFDSYIIDKKKRKSFSSLEKGLEEQLILQHEKKLDAWAARWCFHLFNNDLLTIYPKNCRAINIGLDGTGVNCAIDSNRYRGVLNSAGYECKFEELEVNKRFERAVAKYGKTILERCKTKILVSILSPMKGFLKLMLYKWDNG